MIDKLFGWSFLQEPLWRWFIFLIAITLFCGVWAMCLKYMKG